MIRLALGCVLLLGCPRQSPPETLVEVDPDVLSQRAAERADPGVLRVAFDLRIEGTGKVIPGGLEGVLIWSRGGSFYSEVASGFGPKVLMMAANGESLSLVLPREGLFATETDAEGRLRELTGGVVGLTEFSELLVGRLPLLDAPLIYEGESGLGYGYEATGFSGATVRVELAAASGMVMRTRVEAEDETLLFLLEHTAGSDALPEKSKVEFGVSGVLLELEYSNWQQLDSASVPFVIGAPDGMEVLTLGELRERLTTR